MYKTIKIFAISILLLLPVASFAQEQSKEELDREKKFRENIEKMVENYETTLNLEYWQVFYVDSILTHDFTAMQEEFTKLGKSKVENSDIYQTVSDKWMESVYNAFHKIFNEEQWAKYLKSGAAREKKARDKRIEKSK